MFSYLRPHHKRTPSNPTSPAEQSYFEPQHLDHSHPPRHDALPPEPTRPPPPPLIPIARVSSADSDEGPRSGRFERDLRAQNTDFQKDNTRPRDVYAFSNHQRLPYAAMQRPESAGNAAPSNYTSQPKSGMHFEVTSRPKFPDAGQAFADLQNRPMQGRRPNGTRLPSPPPAPAVSTFEPAQQRSGKARLNLLNPMSLLARRRTSQAVAQLAPESLVTNRDSNFSQSFDPRIRGTVVHDFSAPRRPRRNMSSNDVREEPPNTVPKQFQRSPRGDLLPTDDNPTSPWSGGNHTPVFTENFEEEQYPAAGPHVRKASDLTDLPLPQPPYAKGAQPVVDPQAAAKSNDIVQKQIQATQRISARKPVPDVPPPVPPKNEGQPEPRRISIDPGATPPRPASSKKGRPRGVSEVSAKDGIPKHMKSTSSRFSFDMIGAAEQERLLEDRHRQKALERKAESADEDRLEEEFENGYDYDNMDDDDGLEERIPGINADLDDEDDFYADLEEPIPGVNTELEEEYDAAQDDENLGGFTFQQSTLATPMSPSSPGMVSTPRDVNGEVIGFAMTRNSPHMQQGMQDPSQSSTSPVSPELKSTMDPTFQGLGLHGINIQPLNSGTKLQPPPEVDEFPRPATLEDDDLYFDDGIITGPGDDEDPVEFDESIFDTVDTDEYGRPLKSLPSLPTLYVPPLLGPDKPLSPTKNNNLEATKEPESAISPGTIPSGLAPQPSILEPSKQPSMDHPQSHGLTQDSLAAYQSALAAAAFTAAANGKFRRDSIPPPTPSEQEDAQPGLIPDSSHTSHYEPFSPSYELEDDFDYNDILEDDPIIAAANAEALANDCDGFYGQEFGFYSAPAASEAEYANGGYFGPRGAEGVLRSQSGRVASREPNLTPITERSEYSNRNSFMSLSMHGPGSVSSPGLAQLAGMLRSPGDYDGEMSLDALLKLRSKAWGGSQASLHSSNGGSPRSAGGLEESSPVGQLAPWSHGGTTSAQGHRRKNSTFSLVSEETSAVGTPGAVQSEAGSPPGSPTLTMSFASLDPNAPRSTSPKDERDKEKDRGMRKHRYTGSAESISYLKEDDPVTGERWILERRRTGESGETELLGREVVSGGRI
ncbi:hypothetical protein EG329_013691 [Mollisiaceae sp. DMI_Dod_QoI]|nr:hypothetical protein EG329_013691 [Helotiales sp. DMI_Dod_QoI]